jgi:hypothetical protein
MLSNYAILTKLDRREDEFVKIREDIVSIVDPERTGWFDVHAKLRHWVMQLAYSALSDPLMKMSGC